MNDTDPGIPPQGIAIPETVEEAVSINGPSGRLEGIFNYLPEGTPREAVLVLPPHPRFGGDMANNVVETSARYLAARGYPTLRFNYRGVGASEGPFDGPLDSFRYWAMILEKDAYDDVLEDAEAAFAWIRRVAPIVHLVGYSFGAVLALRMAAGASRDRGVATSVAVALAVGEYQLEFLRDVTVPVLAIHSVDDFATPLETVEEKLRLISNSTLVKFEGTDHFFRGRENEIASLAGDFMSEHRMTCEAKGGRK